jgi:hypothetical protein
MVLRLSQYIRFILCLLFVGVQSAYAFTDKDDKKPTGDGKTPVAQTIPTVNIRTSLAYNRHLVSPESDMEAAHVTVDAASERLKAAGSFSELDKSGRYLDDLADKDLLQLPVGFKKKLGTTGSVEVAVSRAEFFAQYAELTMYVRIALPSSAEGSKEKILYFGAEKVRFTRAGGISSFKAVLLGDVAVVDSPESYSVIIKGAGGLGSGGEIADPNQTYAQIDCGQFTEAQISAEVLIPRKTLIPLTEGTLEPMEGRVTCAFKAKIVGSVDNLVGSLSFKTPFSAPSTNGFAYKVVNASFDISNSSNPSAMTFPTGYVGDQTDAWQGVYIQNFTVFLPKQFKKKGSTDRSSISALNVLVDKTGFSGIVEVNTPIISINEGSASGWAMSLDKIKVGVVQNALTEGSFEGQIRLPVSKGTTLLYKGEIGYSESYLPTSGTPPDLDYSLTVSNADNIDFDLFKAKGKIFAGSSVTLAVIDDEFKPKADLTGELTISTSLDGKQTETGAAIRLEKIEFDNLVLQTGPDPICVKRFELKGKAGIANFPISITALKLMTSCAGDGGPAEAKVFIRAKVAIAGNNDGGGKGFSGEVGVTIKAIQNAQKDWQFDGIVKPIEINIEGDLSAFSIVGRLLLYDNEPAGSGITKKGFRGSAMLTIKSNGLEVCADAEFGSTSGGDNYYYVGGSVKHLPKKIPVGGPIVIDGFAGGIFYHMKPSYGGTGGFKTLCSTGQSYNYSSTTGFGFKAGVNLAATEPLPTGTFDGYAGLEMVFARGGGLVSIGIFAQAQLLGEEDNDKVDQANDGTVKKAEAKGEFNKEPNRNALDTKDMEALVVAEDPDGTDPTSSIFDRPMTAPLAARVGLILNFEKHTFEGEANVYVNVGYLKGYNDGRTKAADRNLAGRLKIHFSDKLWYIHVGTSEVPVGLAIRDLPEPISQSYIYAKAYLMIGDNIPDYLPPLSDAAAEFFKVPKGASTRSSRGSGVASISDINSGKGFAFGLNFEAFIKVGGKIISAEGLLGAGFDILYTTRGNCGLATAKGRVYAFAFVQAKVVGFTVAGLGVGILLEGGAPAPMYFTGIAAIKVNVLGFEYHDTFTVKIGDENVCPPANGG